MHQAWKPVELVPRAQPRRVAIFALAVAALACFPLAVARIFQSISLVTPLQLTTSGAEEEALASIWRFIHGQAVYTDPRVIPYTASYFNWLFYASYGTIAGGALRLLGLGEAWLPTICRCITLAFAMSGAAILAGVTRKITEERIGWPTALLLAGLAFFNPLSGFWVITTRPDVGAAVLELGGVAAFLRYRRTGRWLDLLVVALALGAAWAFKQTSLGALIGIVTALLSPGHSRRPEVDGYRRACWLLAGFGFTALVPWAALGPVYRHGLYLSQIHSGFHPSWALLHFGSALLKMPIIAVALGGAVLTWRQGDRALRIVSLVLGSTFLLEFAASSKGGAGDYYFLSLAIWSVLWLALALDRMPSRALTAAILAAALLQTGAVDAVFAGHVGAVNPRDPAQPYEHLARYLASRPGPVFVRDTYGDLPWISPTELHFVIAYNNEVDEAAGVAFERGGWRGLIATGYFTTVVTRAAHSEITDAMLQRYRLAREETGWCYYERW